MVSDTPTDGRCNWEYDDGGFCESYPMDNGWCFHHGGRNYDNNGAPEGNTNAEDHGAFKEHFRSDLTDEERDAIDDLVSHLTNIDDERAIAAECAAEALMKYKRSADSRFLREARQWFAEFNLIPNEDVFEHTGEGGSPMQVVVQRERYEA